MSEDDIARITLKRGADFPYDASDDWWENGDINQPPSPIDWAHAAARGVLADLNDRGGIKHGFANIDEGIRAEIVAALAAIIRLAALQPP